MRSISDTTSPADRLVNSSRAALAAAFLAGLVSFISPCVLPIVPGYLSFISGVNVAQFKEGGAPRDLVRRVALTSLAFVLGYEGHNANGQLVCVRHVGGNEIDPAVTKR